MGRVEDELKEMRARQNRHSDRATDTRKTLSEFEERGTAFERLVMRRFQEMERKSTKIEDLNVAQSRFMWWSRYVATPIAVALATAFVGFVERACIKPPAAPTAQGQHQTQEGP